MTTFLSRTKEWFRKYWYYLLIVPAILIGLSYAGRFVRDLLTKPSTPPSTREDDDALRDDINKIEEDEKEGKKKIDDDAKKKKDGVDSGLPTAADVFNDTLDKKDEEDKE